MDLMSSALPLPRPSPGGPLPPGGTADILNVCDGELFPENGDQVPSPELTLRKQNGDSVKIQFRRTLELCVNYELGFDFLLSSRVSRNIDVLEPGRAVLNRKCLCCPLWAL